LDSLSVRLALRSGPIAGEVVTLDITQTVLDFPPPEPPALPIGVIVPLEFTTPSLKKTVRLNAMVVGRTEEPNGRRYTFQFKLKEGQDPGDLFRLFNRRTSFRASTNKPVVVNIFPADEAARKDAKPIASDLHDISATGIALIVSPEQDMKIGSDSIHIEFELPTSVQPIKMLATIRYRVLMHSKAVRYGCAFNPNSPGFMMMEDQVMKYLMKHQQQLLKYRGDAD
jgi:c-di-GMP-binding flagellar brake protein YcgR